MDIIIGQVIGGLIAFGIIRLLEEMSRTDNPPPKKKRTHPGWEMLDGEFDE